MIEIQIDGAGTNDQCCLLYFPVGFNGMNGLRTMDFTYFPVCSILFVCHDIKDAFYILLILCHPCY